MRADLTFEMPPGGSRARARRRARRAPPPMWGTHAHAQERDVPVAVVRGLREHGEHELGDRVAMRSHARHRRNTRQAPANPLHACARVGGVQAPRVASGSACGMRGRFASERLCWRACPRPRRDQPSTPGELRELPVFWRSAPVDEGAGAARSICTACPRIATTGRVPRPLGRLRRRPPGFGRSGKPELLTYTIPEYEGFIESYLELIGVERVQLVMHDWGAVGLTFAQRHPERVERLVLIDAVPLLPDTAGTASRGSGARPGLASSRWARATRRVLRYASRGRERRATAGVLT